MATPRSPKTHHTLHHTNQVPPTHYTPIPNDNVDLKLAESYTPLCLCIIKCILVILIHFIISQASIAHAICASVLIIDRITQPILERIVDSNSMAWGVLCSYMTYTIPSKNTSKNVSVIFAVWIIMASVHIMNGGVPMVHSNPSTPFWPGKSMLVILGTHMVT